VISARRIAALAVAAAFGTGLVLPATSSAFTPTQSHTHQGAPTLGDGPRTVALTFDDGPDPTWTPEILQVLAHHHVTAVFCEIGYAVDAYPRVVRRVVRGGHLLCDHTQTHDEHLASRSEKRIRWEIRHAKRGIVAATHGTRPLFFRAPGGNWSSRVERIAGDYGLTPLKWNVDPQDWSRPGVHAIVHTVMEQVRPGGIILMHDGGGDRSQTVAALRIVLRKLTKLGYRFAVPAY
jgi:peptidoglycan-N-acetylglucosamine deacetylase